MPALEGKPGWARVAVPALVLTAVFVAFVPALGGGFVWDDDFYVVHNVAIRSPDLQDLRLIWTGRLAGNYHPLTLLSLALDFSIGGERPAVFHATNVLLHLVNVVLCYAFARGVTGSRGAGWAAALVWGIHPLRVESVAWISSRKDLLYASFFLGSLLAYRTYLAGRRPARSYALALVLFGMSLLSKGMAVSLSLVLPLVDFLERRPLDRRAVVDKVPFFALSILFGGVALWAQAEVGAVVEAPRPLVERWILAGYGFVRYFEKIIWPAGLSCHYPYPAPPGEVPGTHLVFPVLALGALALGVWSLRFTRKVVFALGFFVATIALVLQVVPVGTAVMADRYTYVPFIGIACLLGEGWFRLAGRGRPIGPAFAAAGVIVAAALGVATWNRAGVWHDDLTLWNDAVAKHPESAVARRSRAVVRAERGDLEGAIRDLDEAIRVAPDYAGAYLTRGVQHRDLGNAGDALRDLGEAIRIVPDFAEAYEERGNLAADLGDLDAAVRDLETAVRLAPLSPTAHYNLGYVAGETGDFARAAAEFAEAIRLAPGMVPAHLNRADALARLGRIDEAIDQYDRALSLDPSLAPAWAGRAAARLRKGDARGAAGDARRARELGFPIGDPLRRLPGVESPP